MKRFSSYRVTLFSLLIVLVASLQPFFAVAQTCDEPIGKMVSVQGTVESQKAGGTQWQPVKLNDTLCPGDTIRVLNNSRAQLALANQSVLRINENTTITLEDVDEDRTTLVDLLKGAALFFSRGARKLKVKTQYAIFGVRGTEFFIRTEEGQAFMSVFEGTVLAENQAGGLTVTSDQSTVVEAGRAPVLTVVARPRDAVQWALYYPPILSLPSGETPAAVADDARFLAYRASQVLSVGRVDEAKADIDKALRIDPNFSDALALQSIIAVVQNDKEKALNQAQKAVVADPQSATAQIALSYARQARFDLEGARTSVEAAVKLDPGNAIAWARLADLQASFGELGKALEAAKKAESLAPDLALTQTVLGFAFLTKVNIDESMAAFEKAITLDQAAPLPRLGLGLAKIRKGDLEEGGREIEIAAGLGSSNSLVRSYLGKTYYEEKRTELDGREYATAKKLDPNDPTPWFYDAIRLQTVNRPVEALHNYQKAIELNDNRAIYRSKLLLDSDLAARQSSLARIYNNLGFQQLGLVEGWQSVNTDPTNFSAHRFLSDSYAALPRHEIARVSELLQSQLLQPINITPIQPRLTESNLFLISSQGPSIAGFNTYNPLFNRNQTVLQADGLVGSDSTWGAEGVVSGIYDKLSLSAGYTYFDTDGWRESADQKDSIADVFAQYEFSNKTSLQAEYRYRDTQKGDLALRFDPDDFYPDFKENNEKSSIRFGLRHSFSPRSIFLGSFMYQDNETDRKIRIDDPDAIPTPPGTLLRIEPDFDIDQEAFSGEVQHLFRADYISFTSGVGYFKINGEEQLDRKVSIFFPPPFTDLSRSGFLPPQKKSLDVNHTNLYLYSYINFPKNVIFTVGASADFFNSDSSDTEERNQVNPKFGVAWNPFIATTLRAAAFRVLKRTLITDQTLEPTQVAGFNQFYDDLTSTESWFYGLALDQKFTQNIFGGVAVSKRDLEVPAPVGTVFANQRVNWEENFGRAYFYWTPFRWVALNAEYRYEKFDYADEFNLGARNVTTQSVPLGLNFFHASGLSAMLKGTYFNQDGDFLPLLKDLLPENYVSGDEQFWLFDAALSYRLPKRYGLVTVGVRNLFDKEFKYYETDPVNPSIQPARFFYAVLTLAFP
ncbi:MAG: FecR domain-containing protein [Desulfobacterales bacterium]